MWTKLKKFDVHPKALEGVHQQSLIGAFFTIVTSVITLLLIISEISAFFKIETVSRLIVDKTSSANAIKLGFDVSLHNTACTRISFTQEVTRANIHISGTTPEFQKKFIPGKDADGGCRVIGSMLIDKAAGDFRIGISPEEIKGEPHTLPSASLLHSINYITFYPMQGLPPDDHLTDIPRNISRNMVDASANTAVYQYNIQVVPTLYKTLYGKLSAINQYSINEKVMTFDQLKQVEAIMGTAASSFNGLIFSYDFHPVSLANVVLFKC